MKIIMFKASSEILISCIKKKKKPLVSAHQEYSLI